MIALWLVGLSTGVAVGVTLLLLSMLCWLRYGGQCGNDNTNTKDTDIEAQQQTQIQHQDRQNSLNILRKSGEQVKNPLYRSSSIYSRASTDNNSTALTLGLTVSKPPDEPSALETKAMPQPQSALKTTDAGAVVVSESSSDHASKSTTNQQQQQSSTDPNDTSTAVSVTATTTEKSPAEIAAAQAAAVAEEAARQAKMAAIRERRNRKKNDEFATLEEALTVIDQIFQQEFQEA